MVGKIIRASFVERRPWLLYRVAMFMFWTPRMYCELFWSHCRKIFDRWCYFTVIDRTRWWSEGGSSNGGSHHYCSGQWRWAVSGDSRREQDTLLSSLLLWRMISGKRNLVYLDYPPPLHVFHWAWDLEQCPVMSAAFCCGLMRIALRGIGRPNSPTLSLLRYLWQKAPLSSPNSTERWSKKIKKWLVENVRLNELGADNKVQEAATITAAACWTSWILIDAAKLVPQVSPSSDVTHHFSKSFATCSFLPVEILLLPRGSERLKLTGWGKKSRASAKLGLVLCKLRAGCEWCFCGVLW